MSNVEHTAVQVQVYGRVQGVGFRYHTRSQALKSGVVGWVRNEPDGAVRVVAEGPAPIIESFVNWLRKGPPGARVDDIRIEKREPQGGFSRFTIEHY